MVLTLALTYFLTAVVRVWYRWSKHLYRINLTPELIGSLSYIGPTILPAETFQHFESHYADF
jgi:hypothetical protein